jgi:cell division protein FtsA
MQVTGLKDYVQDPAYASVVGLLLYGQESQDQSKAGTSPKDTVSSLLRKLSSWFKGEF